MSHAPDSSEDGVGGSGPDERLGGVVGIGDEAVGGGLQLDDRGEDAALEVLPGEPGKPAFDRVPPGGVVAFDDYGWKMFHKQKEAEDDFMRRHDHEILELPTGQGLVIRR